MENSSLHGFLKCEVWNYNFSLVFESWAGKSFKVPLYRSSDLLLRRIPWKLKNSQILVLHHTCRIVIIGGGLKGKSSGFASDAAKLYKQPDLHSETADPVQLSRIILHNAQHMS